MATNSGEDFKFPDELDKDIKAEDIEITIESEGDVEIEIEDDTPVADRNRKPLDKEVEDPSDEEIEQYGDKVQKRIKELAHARHDERRAKEAAIREREEAVRVAQQIIEENKRLKNYVSRFQLQLLLLHLNNRVLSRLLCRSLCSLLCHHCLALL